MSDRDELAQALELYGQARVADQMRYYNKTIAEYERTASQTSVAAELLLVVAGVIGLMAAIQDDPSLWLVVVAAGLAAVAGTITAWSETIGFAGNAELYRAACYGLASAHPSRPEPDQATAAEVHDYIDRVEGVLMGEVGAWGETWQSGGGGNSLL